MARRLPRCPLFPYTTLFRSSAVEQAITAYRHTARGLVDEYAELVQKAKTADDQVDEKLPRHSNVAFEEAGDPDESADRKSTRLNSSHPSISYAVFCLKKKKH